MHLARMLHFEAGTRSGEDIEDLHRMRVATRRMRAAWRVFDGAYRRKVQRRYVRELRAHRRALGEVRDIDVLLEDLDDLHRQPARARVARPWSHCAAPGAASARSPGSDWSPGSTPRPTASSWTTTSTSPSRPALPSCGRRWASPVWCATPPAPASSPPTSMCVPTRPSSPGPTCDAPRAAHRGQAAALHDGVLLRGPAGERSADSSPR